MKKTSMMRREHKVSICQGEICSVKKENSLQNNQHDDINFRNQLTHFYEEILAGLSWSA
jgi:hypothetical protein